MNVLEGVRVDAEDEVDVLGAGVYVEDRLWILGLVEVDLEFHVAVEAVSLLDEELQVVGLELRVFGEEFTFL